MKGRWTITVSVNWGLTFEFSGGNVYVSDYEDDLCLEPYSHELCLALKQVDLRCVAKPKLVVA